MDPIKTFVSFSSGDNSFVKHLLARLDELDLNPWDYSRDGSELSLGQEIGASLKEKIATSSLFIAIVSNNSTTSRHCHTEVAHAVELCAQGRILIVPFVDTGWSDPHSEWPGPFAELRGKNLRYCKVNIEDPSDAELALHEICQKLAKRYEPPAEDTPNFPALTRLYHELVWPVPDREDKGNSIYRYLRKAQIQFNRAVRRADYAEALNEIGFIVQMLEKEFPREQFYYPIIAKGICQAECGQLREALETFLSLENHPLRDSNVLGGIGAVLNRQRRYQKAAEVYLDAWRSDRSDLALLHGYIINGLFAGNKMTYEDVCNWISDCRSDDPVSLSKISEIKVLALLSDARHSEAVRCFNELSNDIHSCLGIIIQWSEALLREERSSEALVALTSFH
jgi:tetratricopeptide (TPR) repeat protein